MNLSLCYSFASLLLVDFCKTSNNQSVVFLGSKKNFLGVYMFSVQLVCMPLSVGL